MAITITLGVMSVIRLRGAIQNVATVANKILSYNRHVSHNTVSPPESSVLRILETSHLKSLSHYRYSWTFENQQNG